MAGESRTEFELDRLGSGSGMSETEPTRELIARVRELDDIDPRRTSWWRCDECNSIVSCDEDGCCTACGDDARLIVSYHPTNVHELAGAAVPLANEVDRLTAQAAEQAQEIATMREREFRMSVRAGRTEASDMASLSFMRQAKAAQDKLRAVEALRDELTDLGTDAQKATTPNLAERIWDLRDKLSAILAPEAQ